MKVCSRRERCVVGNVEQPLSEFYRHIRGGHESWCKSCKKRQLADYHARRKAEGKTAEREARRHAPRFGEANNQCRFSSEQIAQIRALGGVMRQAEIAARFGTTREYISRVIRYEARPFG